MSEQTDTARAELNDHRGGTKDHREGMKIPSGGTTWDQPLVERIDVLRPAFRSVRYACCHMHGLTVTRCCEAVNQRLKRVVRKIRTLRSV